MFGYMPEPMANLVRTIVRFVSDTPVVIPLLMFPVAVWVCYQAWARVGVPSIARWIAATTFFFGASDGLLMAALPHLGLSFGPVGLPWLGVSLARALLAWGVAVTCRVRRELVVSAILLGILNLAILACEVYGLYIEPFNVSVTHQRITLFSQSDPVQLRIVQLSDLHVERVTQRERTVLKMVEQSKPDLILLTGDYLNTSYVNDETARRDARDWLSQLRAPRGVYAVPGSPSVDTRDAIESLFDDMDNITLLRNQIVQLDVDGQTICLIGVTNQWQERDRASLKALMKQVPSDALTILLYHTPDLIETAANLDVDVYLAGHTHGGQVRLPWFGAIVTSSRYGKRYEAGPYQVGTTHLYVNRGIGMEGSGALRVRWLCPPEVAEMEISVVEKAP